MSSNGGGFPRWSLKGNELFYWETDILVGGSGPMMSVPVETEGVFRRGRPRRLFDAPEGIDFRIFSVSPDGRRFLAMRQGEGDARPQTVITVVQNWARAFEGR